MLKFPVSIFGHFLSYASFQVLLAQVLWHYYVRSFWGQILPWELSTLELSCIVMVTSGILLVAGHYRLLDGLTKWIIALLTVATVVAVFIAAGKPSAISADFIPASPWNLAALGFIVALMGWMPAPLEFSAVTSVWTAKKIRTDTPIAFKVLLILMLVILLQRFWQYFLGTWRICTIWHRHRNRHARRCLCATAD